MFLQRFYQEVLFKFFFAKFRKTVFQYLESNLYFWKGYLDFSLQSFLVNKNQFQVEFFQLSQVSEGWVGLGRVRLGQVRLVQVRLGQFRLGQVRLGQVRLGQVRLGQVRLGQVRQGSLGHKQLRQIKLLTISIGKKLTFSVYMSHQKEVSTNRQCRPFVTFFAKHQNVKSLS